MKALIIAGGSGSRLKGVAPEGIPKPLVQIDGKPVLLLQIELLKKYGFREVILLTGYLPEKIEDYFGNGAEFGMKISYDREPFPLGTAGCIKQVEESIEGDFIVFNGDQMMDFNINKMIDFHFNTNTAATLFLHPNDHPFDSDLIDIDDNGAVTQIHPKPHSETMFYRNLVNAGVYIFGPTIFKYLQKEEKADLGRDLLPRLLSGNERLMGYVSAEYVKDMGTPERLEEVRRDFVSGRIRASNSSYKRPAIFLDRDGVINKEINLLSNIDEFELLPGVPGAIKKINNSGYLCIVITNQPVIARNLLDFKELRAIHNKMEWLLGKEGCYLDGIYFCPHHPDSGYPEERKELKIECECRKPKPGMILKAVDDFNIDIERSYIVGDRHTDILTGKNTGIKTVQVKTNGIEWESTDADADFRAADLLDAVNLILDKNGCLQHAD